MYDVIGANDFTIEELNALFDDDDDEVAQETPPENVEAEHDGTTEPTEPTEPSTVDTTKAFAKRLKESTDKVRLEERDAIAKSLGYLSYDDLQHKQEAKLLEDNGLNTEDVTPIVEELVKKRLDNDPRMKELSALRELQIKEYGKRELEELSKLTNGEISKFEQLPKEVVDLWKTKGSLKAAYIELKGEELIIKARAEQSRGTTDHLANPTGKSPTNHKVRLLTPEEKSVWKLFNPNISDDDLNKKTTEI